MASRSGQKKASVHTTEIWCVLDWISRLKFEIKNKKIKCRIANTSQVASQVTKQARFFFSAADLPSTKEMKQVLSAALALMLPALSLATSTPTSAPTYFDDDDDDDDDDFDMMIIVYIIALLIIVPFVIWLIWYIFMLFMCPVRRISDGTDLRAFRSARAGQLLAWRTPI